jgi:high-affinity nickel-transport protein
MFDRFGFGFDTASEIALLGVSALAKARGIPSSEIIILPLLFTAGMTVVDSADSVFMLLAYSAPLGPSMGFGSGWRGWRLFATAEDRDVHDPATTVSAEALSDPPVCVKALSSVEDIPSRTSFDREAQGISKQNHDEPMNYAAKMATLSGVSIGLTIISIAMALVISIVRFLDSRVMGVKTDEASKRRLCRLSLWGA